MTYTDRQIKFMEHIAKAQGLDPADVLKPAFGSPAHWAHKIAIGLERDSYFVRPDGAVACSTCGGNCGQCGETGTLGNIGFDMGHLASMVDPHNPRRVVNKLPDGAAARRHSFTVLLCMAVAIFLFTLAALNGFTLPLD